MTQRQTRSGKIYKVGLPCTYRNWRAESHCRFLHGYDLGVEFEFSAEEMDARGWVVDFGGLKDLRGWLEDWFDHKTLAAEDDPLLHSYEDLAKFGAMDLRVLPSIGAEAFANMIFEYTAQWLIDAGFGPRCRLESVIVRENEKNYAKVIRQD